MKISTGFEELDRLLALLPTTVARKMVREVARPAMKGMKKQIQKAAPVKSGRLKKSIGLKAMKRSRKFIGVRVTTDSKNGSPFYASFSELGTGEAKDRKKIRWMYRAYLRKRKRTNLIFAKKLGKAIVKWAKDG